MDNYRQIVRNMRDNMIQIRHNYWEELQACPRGSLWKTEQGGRTNYFWAYREGNGYIRKGISSNPQMQQQLARKAYLTKSLKLLDRNILQLNKLLNSMEPLELGAIVSRLTKAYQDLPGEYFLCPPGDSAS